MFSRKLNSLFNSAYNGRTGGKSKSTMCLVKEKQIIYKGIRDKY